MIINSERCGLFKDIREGQRIYQEKIIITTSVTEILPVKAAMVSVRGAAL